MSPDTKEELDALQAKHTKRFTLKDKKDTIARFKETYPDIMAFNPKVMMHFTDEFSTTELPEVYVFDPPIPQISIFRKMIFDTRLVPDEFEDVKVVVNFWVNEYPKEYIKSFSDLNETVFKKYVEDQIDEIRTKFNNPELSKQEAFEAITGGFIDLND